MSRSEGAQRSGQGMPTPGLRALEEMEWLPPTQPGRDQDALLRAAGREGDGAHIRASVEAATGGLAQPTHPAGHVRDGGGRPTEFEVRGRPSCWKFSEQSLTNTNSSIRIWQERAFLNHSLAMSKNWQTKFYLHSFSNFIAITNQLNY